MKDSYIYIMASQKNGTLYTGVTTDLKRRVFEHKNNLTHGFTAKYSIHELVFFEQCSDIRAAIEREKVIKGWSRKKKISLIESLNPGWKDISKEWL